MPTFAYQKDADTLRTRAAGLIDRYQAYANKSYKDYVAQNARYEAYLKRMEETQKAAEEESKRHNALSSGLAMGGAVIGGIAGGIYGGPMGAMAGASAGGALGNMAGSMINGTSTGGQVAGTVASVAPALMMRRSATTAQPTDAGWDPNLQNAMEFNNYGASQPAAPQGGELFTDWSKSRYNPYKVGMFSPPGR